MAPDQAGKHPALIYLHPAGKSIEARIEKEIEWFVNHGFVVLAPDLPGIGETGSVDDLEAFLGVQTRRSVVGMRAAEIVRAARYLNTAVTSMSITSRRWQRAAQHPSAHATALDSSFRNRLNRPLLRCGDEQVLQRPVADLVPMLTVYDLPDLAARVAPRPR
jgi:hypothetical protein